VDSWRQIFDLNVLGLSICTKEAIESMNEKQVDGHIIHINRSVTLQSYICKHPLTC
jgi:NADP-dependent 3-hydroxy acid dehydrogenase YdfG